MITLHPNNYIKEYIISEEQWTIFLDYIKYLNNMEIIPVLTDNNFMDIEKYDGYSFSSNKVQEISEMISNSIQNKRIEEYKYQYNDYDDLRFPTSFPEYEIYNFLDFLSISGGFYISKI